MNWSELFCRCSCILGRKSDPIVERESTPIVTKKPISFAEEEYMSTREVKSYAIFSSHRAPLLYYTEYSSLPTYTKYVDIYSDRDRHDKPLAAATEELLGHKRASI